MDQLFPRPGHRNLHPRSFAPATSTDASNGAIVLQKDYLALPKDSKYGIPGFFQLPADDKSLQTPSYNLVIKGIPFAGHDIVRCIITPASDITIVPMNLQDHESSSANKVRIERTRYILKSYEHNSSCMVSGYRANVKFKLVLRSAKDLAQIFQIDGAVLLDPGLQPPQLPVSGRPVCLLGMDFIMKYPYLLYVPRFDSRGMVDFMISRDPFASRSYSIHEQFYKAAIVHVDGHYNEDTGNIGCGVFFKSGSIFNIFSGVSKYDKAGIKHTKKLKERGILMAIIKALHVVCAFPVGRDFRGVIIRSTDPAIARLMAVTQVTMKNVFTDSIKGDEDGFDPMEGGYYYPTANRDLMLYFCHTFLRTELGFKITFEDSKKCDEAVAASSLAMAGSQMEEFYAESPREKAPNSQKGSLLPQIQPRGMRKTEHPDITPLENYFECEGSPVYIGLGFDGYFYIQQGKAHAAMEGADKAGLNTIDEIMDKVKIVISNRESLESVDINNIEYSAEIPHTEQSLEKDSKVTDSHKDDPNRQDQTRMNPTERPEEDSIDLAMLSQDLGPGSKKQELLRSCCGMREPGATKANVRITENGKDHQKLWRIEKIRMDAKAKISRVKYDGLFEYESLERQMNARIAQIGNDCTEKREEIFKEAEAQIAAARAEYSQKRNIIVGKTKALIKEIDTMVHQEIEMVQWKFSAGVGGMWKANNGNTGFENPPTPLR